MHCENGSRNKLRVFVSYTHKDQAIMKGIVAALKKMDVVPVFDRNFSLGTGFHEQIKLYISHAHIFIPILTKESVSRGWVHQEIGYAASLNVPFLPISCNGAMPGEMIGQLHALDLRIKSRQSERRQKRKHERKDLQRRVEHELSERLTRADLVKLAHQQEKLSRATFECAPFPEDRTDKMVAYAETVSSIQASIPDLKNTAKVRQLGALSSFHIPDAPLSDRRWKNRYGSRGRSKHHCWLQRRERRALTKLAAENGCRIIVSHKINYGEYGDVSRISRLSSLLEFLTSNEVGDVQIAFENNQTSEKKHSLTLVGDWYCAEAVTAKAGHGYDQTIFTRHAPSMAERIDEFDERFFELLGKVKPQDSRRVAIYKLQKYIKNLKRRRKQAGELAQSALCWSDVDSV